VAYRTKIPETVEGESVKDNVYRTMMNPYFYGYYHNYPAYHHQGFYDMPPSPKIKEESRLHSYMHVNVIAEGLNDDGEQQGATELSDKNTVI